MFRWKNVDESYKYDEDKRNYTGILLCMFTWSTETHKKKVWCWISGHTWGDPKASLKCTWDAIFCDLGADYLRHVPSVRKHQLFLINVNFCYTNKMLFQKVQYFILGGLIAQYLHYNINMCRLPISKTDINTGC